MTSSKKFALIVAGGKGNRMNNPSPKQFIEINGKPLLIHTFEAFLKSDPHMEFILVLPEGQIKQWKNVCHTFHFRLDHTLVPGGESRFHSVKNGLEQIKEEGIVFIHDGVRPLVSVQTIEHCYQKALTAGNAIPVVSPPESIREVLNGKNRGVDRRRYFLVQTPQTFRTSLIKKAYEQPWQEKFTDDASVLENTETEIHLVEGNRTNIKITFPDDLWVAETLLQKQTTPGN